MKTSLIKRDSTRIKPTNSQREWLNKGISMGKDTLPLFSATGQRFNKRTVKSCLDLGWVTPVMKDPTYSRLTIYKLTEKGEQVLSDRRG